MTTPTTAETVREIREKHERHKELQIRLAAEETDGGKFVPGWIRNSHVDVLLRRIDELEQQLDARDTIKEPIK